MLARLTGDRLRRLAVVDLMPFLLVSLEAALGCREIAPRLIVGLPSAIVMLELIFVLLGHAAWFCHAVTLLILRLFPRKNKSHNLIRKGPVKTRSSQSMKDMSDDVLDVCCVYFGARLETNLTFNGLSAYEIWPRRNTLKVERNVCSFVFAFDSVGLHTMYLKSLLYYLHT